MNREIRLYVEGGGHLKATIVRFRTAMGEFLRSVREKARAKRIGWFIKACGGRRSAYDDFRAAVKSNPEAFNVLLVDAEGPVAAKRPWEHLKTRPGDQWQNPGVGDDHCHLMVQTMEAWLIADREKLKEYYGRGFQETALPDNPNVEQIDKDALATALRNATRSTKKGSYHKTRHAPDILQRIRTAEVRAKAAYCDRLFQTLIAQIDDA